MRFHTTIQFSEKRQAWEQAYEVQDGFASKGDDGTQFKNGTPEADAAYEAEETALTALLFHPTVTPAELQDKIAVMRRRGPLAPHNLCWDGEEIERTLDTIERDLIAMVRPNVSPAVATAFSVWAQHHALYWSRGDWSDDDSSRLCDAETEAEKALYEVPCTTPGDFIAKAYVELISEYGAKGSTSDGLAFMVDDNEHLHHFTDKARLRDLMETDLGCCMAALGTVDFDAKAYVIQCRRFGKRLTVMRSIENGERARGLMLGMDGPHTAMGDLLDRLPANGLRMIAGERCKAIADEIEAHWPEHICGSYEGADAPELVTAQ
jgi:hypothetical protein